MRISGLFAGAGIGLLAYKGPALSQLAYGDPLLRISSDLDLLVRPETVFASEELLLKHGYRRAEAETGTGRHPQDDYHRAFVRADGRGLVELHRGFAPDHYGTSFDLDGIWNRSEVLPWPGAIVRTPAPVDLLPLLCEHGAKHCWERLEWLCAVAGLIERHRDRDWSEVADSPALALGLQLCQKLLQVELPEGLNSIVERRPMPQRLVNSVRHWLASENGAISKCDRNAFVLATRPTLRARWQYVRFHLFNVNERDGSIWRRPFRLLRTYVFRSA